MTGDSCRLSDVARHGKAVDQDVALRAKHPCSAKRKSQQEERVRV